MAPNCKAIGQNMGKPILGINERESKDWNEELKNTLLFITIFLARTLGFEPRIKVLETFVMPFHYAPMLV